MIMNLISKIIPVASDASFFRAALRLPKPSAEYLIAKDEARRASSNLRSLKTRREALQIEACVDNPCHDRLATQTLHSMLDDLEADIRTATERDREAFADLGRLRLAYRDQAHATLADDIEGLGALIAQRLEEVRELLEIAEALNSQAREAQVEMMPTLIREAPIALRLLEPVAATINKMIEKGTRR
ncbi:MAG: hypothetical protein E5V67_04195 [Mesorhizobium sp.]|nr:MAG: hypothetical protein EOQ53_07820 [Mesorhizobium sp.]TIU88396.1 MAG: hypothetical protein E5W06_02175 [Mesorhizobium sp.]TKB43225.1 MAG: hypothetical protein E5V67_04195 [Mesorhizobium sp.]